MIYTSNEVPGEILAWINRALDRRERGYAWRYLAFLMGDGSEPNGCGTRDAHIIRAHLRNELKKGT